MPTTEQSSPRTTEAIIPEVSFSLKLFSLYFDPHKIPSIQFYISCLQGAGKEEEEKMGKEQKEEEEMAADQDLEKEEKEKEKGESTVTAAPTSPAPSIPGPADTSTVPSTATMPTSARLETPIDSSLSQAATSTSSPSLMPEPLNSWLSEEEMLQFATWCRV